MMDSGHSGTTTSIQLPYIHVAHVNRGFPLFYKPFVLFTGHPLCCLHCKPRVWSLSLFSVVWFIGSVFIYVIRLREIYVQSYWPGRWKHLIYIYSEAFLYVHIYVWIYVQWRNVQARTILHLNEKRNASGILIIRLLVHTLYKLSLNCM